VFIRCIITVCRPLFTVKKRTNSGHCFLTVESVGNLVCGRRNHGAAVGASISTETCSLPVKTGYRLHQIAEAQRLARGWMAKH
uniref:hypothetical protein n=1 Tax=Halalkalibacter flavus TaxID=3090668 RepID=UPI002FCCA130